MSRVTMLRPLGLVTEPNEFGQYPPGALAQAVNACLRKPGVLEPLPAFINYRTGLGGAGDRFLRMWGGENRTFAWLSPDEGATADLVSFTGASTTAITSPDLGALSVAAGKAQMASHRGRYYFTTEQGVIALGSETDNEAFRAGFAAPSSVQEETEIASGQAIQDDHQANYRALFSRKAADGSYIKIGPPSSSVRITNTSGGTVDYEIRVTFSDDVAASLAVGDLVELYRTESQEIGTDPGEDYLLVREQALTSPELAAGYTIIRDSVPNDGLGAALYTNDGEQGAESAKYPPPYATDIAMFKGHAFYVAPLLNPSISVRVPGVWGILVTDAERRTGIGIRSIDGDTTSGSDTITNVDNMIGLQAGQRLGGPFPGGLTTIVTVNLAMNELVVEDDADSTGSAVTLVSYDVMVVNGDEVTVGRPAFITEQLPASNSAQFTFDQTLTPDENQTGVSFSVSAPYYSSDSPELQATNGQNYSPVLPHPTAPPLEASSDERENRVLWSELDQPEAVPPANELLIGHGTIYRLISTLDAIYAWCSDGLWRVSGQADEWRVDPIDPTLVLAARNAVDLARQIVWALTNRGLVAVIDGSGVQEVSSPVLGMPIGTQALYADTWGRWVTCIERNNEVWVWQVLPIVGSVALIYNTLSKGFTNCVVSSMGGSIDSDGITATADAKYLPGPIFGDIDNRALTFSASERCEGVDITHQPVTGDDDPYTSKQWIDATWLIKVPDSDGLALLPRVNGTEFDPSVEVLLPQSLAPRVYTQGVCGMPLNGMNGPHLEVGWRITDNPSQAWEFHGLSIRFRPTAEQGYTR